MNNNYGIRQVDWKAVEKTAKKLSVEQLHYAMNDCLKAAQSLKGIEGYGACKGESYYRDECSVYSTELRRRNCLKR